MPQGTLFTVEAQCVKVATHGMNQLKISFESQEGLSDRSLSEIIKWHGKHGHLMFLSEPPLPDEIANLPPLKDGGTAKSRSQTMRNSLYKLYMTKKEHGDEVPDSFNAFYDSKMEALTNSIDELCL